jgi:hypothetical protein
MEVLPDEAPVAEGRSSNGEDMISGSKRTAVMMNSDAERRLPALMRFVFPAGNYCER